MKAHLQQLLIFLMVGAIGGCYNEVEDIYNQVALDAVDQYEIAKRQGDKISICVQAGLVSASYLQAKDEPNYIKWKKIESNDCRRAGLPS